MTLGMEGKTGFIERVLEVCYRPAESNFIHMKRDFSVVLKINTTGNWIIIDTLTSQFTNYRGN